MLAEFKMECHEEIGLTKPSLEVRPRIERRSRIQNRTSNIQGGDYRLQSTGRRYDLQVRSINNLLLSSAVSAFPALTLTFCQNAMERHLCIVNSDCCL